MICQHVKDQHLTPKQAIRIDNKDVSPTGNVLTLTPPDPLSVTHAWASSTDAEHSDREAAPKKPKAAAGFSSFVPTRNVDGLGSTVPNSNPSLVFA